MLDSFATPWTVAHQAPLSMGFPGKNTGLGCHFLQQGIFLIQGLNLHLLLWQADSLPLSHQGSPNAECITQNAGLDESQVEIKTAKKSINFRYAYDTTLMAESEEELKEPLNEGERGK